MEVYSAVVYGSMGVGMSTSFGGKGGGGSGFW